MIEDLLSEHKVKHRTYTPYRPKANEQTKVTNKVLEGIVTKVVSNNMKYWVYKVVKATLACNTT